MSVDWGQEEERKIPCGLRKRFLTGWCDMTNFQCLWQARWESRSSRHQAQWVGQQVSERMSQPNDRSVWVRGWVSRLAGLFTPLPLACSLVALLVTCSLAVLPFIHSLAVPPLAGSLAAYHSHRVCYKATDMYTVWSWKDERAGQWAESLLLAGEWMAKAFRDRTWR